MSPGLFHIMLDVTGLLMWAAVFSIHISAWLLAKLSPEKMTHEEAMALTIPICKFMYTFTWCAMFLLLAWIGGVQR